ncbi:MAG TPA: hypothetical protein PLC42_03450 [Parachlamydiaceae bacterium]|nr:hypothetical protein [Parachlamydiaceae bacterium]
MQVTARFFFIHPENNACFEEGIKRTITFSDRQGRDFYQQTFDTKPELTEFLNTYCYTPWKKEHPLISLFKKNIEGLNALKEGMVVASVHTLRIIIHEELLNLYVLDGKSGFFYFFKAVIKTKKQCFNIYTKGLTTKSITVNLREYEYHGLKNRETGETFPAVIGPPLKKRQRASSLP